MSSSRARANHALYLARIQIAAWQEQVGREQIRGGTLAQAFLPAVGNHLQSAYGYFLLTLIGAAETEHSLPTSASDLPEIPRGKMLPPEIAEFQILEQEGWLTDMLAFADSNIAIRTSRVVVAPELSLTPAAAASPEQALVWCDALQTLFDRMSDSLDEY